MIAFVNGKLSGKTLGSAIVNVGGIGYEAQMSQKALSDLPDVGSDVLIYTYLQVSDNGVALYGFMDDDEKFTFEQLIGVSGVGPKMALAALSTFSPQALAAAITAQDISLVSKIPGVGKKTASRIILELKGSLDANDGGLFASHRNSADENMKAAMEALSSMGFTSDEIGIAMKGAPVDASESELLKYGLKRLGA